MKALQPEDLTKMIEEIMEFKRKYPKPVIYFCPYITAVLAGPMIDMVLGCDDFERGYFVPISLRSKFYDSIKPSMLPSFEEREPGRHSNWKKWFDRGIS